MSKSSFVAVLLFGAVAAVGAQQTGFTRTMLQQADISAPGREAVTARAEFHAPGASVGRHTHFGEEIGYVIEGTLSVEIDGVTVKAGEAFIVPNACSTTPPTPAPARRRFSRPTSWRRASRWRRR